MTLLLAVGFDDAILGIAESYCNCTVVCYDYEKCCEILMEREGWDRMEAEEWMQYNVVSAHMGKGTPAFLYRMTLDEINEAES